MSLKSAFILLAVLSLALISGAGPVQCERTMYLTVCQELVNIARSHEARAAQHNRAAKVLMMQIENMAKLPKNQGTVAGLDTLFSQYDENRVMERKFRELYQQVSEEAKQCMKSAEW